MLAARSVRQTIPRWALTPEAPAAIPRTATVIRLPLGAARSRRVLTFPAAIAVPPRVPEEEPPMEQTFSAPVLVALTAPTALLSCVVVLLNLLP